MAKQFLTPIDLGGNELRNAVHQSVGTLPAADTRKFQFLGVGGDLFWSDGVEWTPVRPPESLPPSGPAGGHLQGTFPNPQLNDETSWYLRERGNHNGTQTADTISNFDAQVRTTRLDEMAAATSPFTAPDPTQGAHVANKGYVDQAVADLVESAPETLNTLNELAAALGDDPNFATTVANQIGTLDTKIDGVRDDANQQFEQDGLRLDGIDTRLDDHDTRLDGHGTRLDAVESQLGALKYAVDLSGGGTSETVTHNLNTQDVHVAVRTTTAPFEQVEMDVEITSVNSVTVRSATSIPASTYRVVVLG